jgi:hypothetical protein
MENYDWEALQKQAEKGGGGQPIPSSEYTVQVSSAEAKMSSTGKPMLKVKGKVVGGPHEGRTLFTQYTLSTENDTAVAIFLRHLAAFGLDKEYFAVNPSFEKIAYDLHGRYAVWEVGQKVYKNEKRNEVTNTKPAPGAGAAVPQPGVPQVPVPPAPVPPQAPVPAPMPPAAPVPAPAPAPPAPAPQAPYAAPGPAPVPVTETVPVSQVSTTPAPPAPPF